MPRKKADTDTAAVLGSVEELVPDEEEATMDLNEMLSESSADDGSADANTLEIPISTEEEDSDVPAEEPVATTPAAPASALTSQSRRPGNYAEKQARDAAYQHERDKRQGESSQLAALITASKAGTTLNAMITGVEQDRDRAYWVCHYGPARILIPFEDAYTTNSEEALLKGGTRETISRQSLLLTKSVGATIPFIITSFGFDSNGESVAYGSRTSALARIRSNYFGNNAANKLMVGAEVDAQIISVSDYAAYVCCCGLDCRIANHHLTFRYLNKVSDEYCVGQTIRLRVKSIKTAPGKLPVVSLSGKPIELAAAKPRLASLKKRVGGRGQRNNPVRYMATVTSVAPQNTASGRSIVVRLHLEGIEAPAFSRDYRAGDKIVRSGSKVYVRVNGVTEDGYAHVRIERIIQY